MVKKQPSAAQLAARKAAGERLKKLHADKKQKINEAEAQATRIAENPPEMKPNTELGDLLSQLAELKDNPLIMALLGGQQAAPTGPQVTSRGLVGTFEKYIIDPAVYPNPVERLMEEPRLQRFAFKDNFEVEYTVSTSEYDTKDGIHTREPRFTLELIRVVYDDETGERTNGRYVVCRGTFHEDPQAAIVIARENGIEVDEKNEKAFLDEMRYIRMRDWLLEAFYPAKPDQKKKNTVQRVIGNRLVDFYEVDDSEKGGTINWDKVAEKKFKF